MQRRRRPSTGTEKTTAGKITITTTEQLDPVAFNLPEDGFDKELLGLTGGFPGGEKGLKDFIQKNPPPKKPPPTLSLFSTTTVFNPGLTRKPKAPELPLLMPGMIAIVKNPNSPYHMYCGIVQRITDGKAGVLFEGGNWDRLITFKLNELERHDKGPPMPSIGCARRFGGKQFLNYVLSLCSYANYVCVSIMYSRIDYRFLLWIWTTNTSMGIRAFNNEDSESICVPEGKFVNSSNT